MNPWTPRRLRDARIVDTINNRKQGDGPDPLGDETWYGCESLIRAFEEAWGRGERPAIRDFLMAHESRQGELLHELVHVDLEFRLKAGEAARVEDYLANHPELANHSNVVLELLVAEYDLRRRTEVGLEIDEFRDRFPAFADQLAERLAATRRESDETDAKAVEPRTPPLDLPEYEILTAVGRGGMGVVYQAKEKRLGRHVALKFLPPELSNDPTLMQRFVREAKTASGLNHPHICTVHALGEHAGCPYLVLEFIEGQTLRPLAASRPGLMELARLISQVAGALAAAHAAGVVHRDIKPENVMVRSDGYVKVLDFGLARRLPTLSSNAGPASHDTWPGSFVGTVAYMSPEQARGEPLDGSSDVFSLGIVLYQLVTGQHPFERSTPFETLYAIANTQAVPLRRLVPSASAALERLTEAMLQKDARLRPTAAEVAKALAELARGGHGSREPSPKRIVHRQRELAALRDALISAEAGSGAVVCVAGEPGIGKTTLVEDFLDELIARGTCQLARGHCSERHAAASAYLPVIDALADLLRGETGHAVGRLLPLVAPTWSAQLASIEGRGTAPSALALSQQAMLRELASLLSEISRLGTVILFIDDVHWADLSTVDLLAYIGRQCRSLPVLIITTFRPTELLLGPHPFHRVKLELQGQGVCTELALGFLGRDQIEDYLSLAFPGHRFPADFVDLVHSRTEGSPLFMVDLLRYLRERGVIAEADGRWTVASELPEIWHDLPETVRSMIERKLEQLDADDHRLLSIAAAQGHQFDSAVVAEVAGYDPADVEERLQVLARVHGLVRLLREDEFPDRTPTLRYSFVHVLYQQAFYASLLPTRRRAVNKSLAEVWQRHLGDEAVAFAPELACLYEAGREPAQAARQYYLAAQQAARVFAHRDAIGLARRGLDLLESLPPGRDRQLLELPLQTLLGLQLQVTEGYASHAAEKAYERARDLCPSTDEARFPVLWGLWLVRKVRSELVKAQKLAEDLLDVARRLQAPDLGLQAHQALGLTALCRGRPAECLRHVEQVAALYNVEQHRSHAFQFGQDPGVICTAYGAIALWLLGFPESARRESEKAIEMSQGLSPNSQAVASFFAAMAYQWSGDDRRTRQCLEATATVSGEHGFRFWLAGSTIIGGWSLATSGDTQAGIRRLKQGLDEWRATGSVTYLTYYLALLAESLGAEEDWEAAHRVAEEALVLVERTDERMIEPELHRLLGEARWRLAPHDSSALRLAEASFRQALLLAEGQESKSLQLRAALSLAKVQAHQKFSGDGRSLLARLVATFVEGHDLRDLREARSFLGQAPEDAR